MNISILHESSATKAAKRAITIGAFDGFHLGHQKLLEKLSYVHKNLLRTLITFEPLPHEFFSKKAHPRLMSLRDKVVFLKERNLVDELLIIPFNARWAEVSAEDFVSKILIDQCGMSALVVGEDFRFGAKAKGDTALLNKMSGALSFAFHSESHDQCNGSRISSTRIRTALDIADLDTVNRLLGRHYSITGKVIYGNQLARTWGIPTINVALKHTLLPLVGVFNVHATNCRTNVRYNGIANIGMRPTVDGTKGTLEVHLHNMNENLYGSFFKIEFLSKLRDEKKFDNLDRLRAQVEQDVFTSRDYFLRLLHN